ncbi:MAG TPA: hypothetical protein VN700_04875 [Vicinamibacterales bacterium]|nr:hypothetical protein [Vicinamibacterales bacterium]
MSISGARHIVVTAALAAVIGVSATSPAFSQTQDPPVTTTPAVQAPERPIDLDRIREGVTKPPQLIIDDGKLKIYVEVIAKWPRFSDLVKGYDLRNGPTARGNPMTHAEFLQMVTPREMYGSGGIRATEMFQMALVNWAGKALIKKGLEAIGNARNEREIAEIRARIDRELAALRGGR